MPAVIFGPSQSHCVFSLEATRDRFDPKKKRTMLFFIDDVNCRKIRKAHVLPYLRYHESYTYKCTHFRLRHRFSFVAIFLLIFSEQVV